VATSVKTIIAGKDFPICVSQRDKVEYALDLMSANDYSQLPVIDENKQPIGLVNANSILYRLVEFGTIDDNLMIGSVMGEFRSVDESDVISDVLEKLEKHAAVLVIDAENKLKAIITQYDVTEYFRRRAENIMLVEDIEQNIREHIQNAIPDDELQDTIDNAYNSKFLSDCEKILRRYIGEAGAKFDPNLWKKIASQSREVGKKIDRLTLTQAAQILAGYWEKYGDTFPGTNKTQFEKRLSGITEIRNKLAHFRDEVTSREHERLYSLARWLESCPPQKTSSAHNSSPEANNPLSELIVPEPKPDDQSGEQGIPIGEVIEPDESRYANIAIYLNSRGLGVDELTLSFSEIEQIIGGELPISARQHRSWWANDSTSHVQSQQWLNVGWRVASINLTAARVTFVRTSNRAEAYIRFFSELIKKLRSEGTFPIGDISPQGVSWQIIGTFRTLERKQMAALSYSFTRTHQFRTELYIDGGDAAQNKELFDYLVQSRSKIEQDLNDILSTEKSHGVSWERLDHRRASRVAIYHEGSIEDSEALLEALQSWAVKVMITLQKVMSDTMKPRSLTYSSK
jgi:hypothetical protein